MLYWLAMYLTEHVWGAFRIFQYLSMRSIMAVLTGLAVALIIGPIFIARMKAHQIGQFVRQDGPQSHLSKAGTPTMGGALIIAAITVATLLWANLANPYVWVVLGCLLAFGAVGWVDDYRKVIRKQSLGLRAKEKYFWSSLAGFSAAIALYCLAKTPAETALLIPYVKSMSIPLGLLFIPFTYCVIVGASNSVNMTDGLDGLAIMPTIMVAGALGIFAYLTGNIEFAKYLDIPYVVGAGEVVVFCAAIFGAGLGFLWFNTHPALVFMGDVGALALGAALGAVAVVVRQELVFFIMAGLFVMETLSVFIQVGSYRLTGKRVFKMAPLHHHFELKGWPEPRVIVRFWIITVVLVLIGLASLKIR